MTYAEDVQRHIERLRASRTQAEAAEVYAEALRSDLMPDAGFWMDMNDEIRKKWPSRSGLLSVKNLAWKIVTEEVKP